MEFFKVQRRARRKTALLAIFFSLSSVAYIFFTYFVLQVIWNFVLFASRLRFHKNAGQAAESMGFEWLNPLLFQFVVIGTIVFLLSAAILKFKQFREGSHRYATMYLGGRPVRRGGNQEKKGSESFGEQQFQNIVEEMAIASGIPVPGCYILEHQRGINGFAFATDPRDAAVIVTRGAIDLLDRDELQGLVAHEFSHLVSGDTRLNCVMLAILNGYIFLWEVQIKLRDEYTRWLYYIFVPALTAASFGLPLANLIKCAISRTREFRADAFAVQATRNPEGLAGALKKIGGWHAGSRMKQYWAEELSHFYFANGVSKSESGWFSTHPPLVKRIKSLDPYFHESFPRVVRTLERPEGKGKDLFEEFSPSGKTKAFEPVEVFGLSKEALGLAIGSLTFDSLCYAAAIREHLSASLKDAYIDNDKAPAVLYAILFLDLVETGAREQAELPSFLSESERKVFISSYQEIRGFAVSLRLPLVDLIVETIADLPQDERLQIIKNCRELLQDSSDQNFLAWIIEMIIERRVEPGPPQSQASEVNIVPSSDDKALAELLSVLARFAHPEDSQKAAGAWKKGASYAELAGDYIEKGKSLDEFRSSLEVLSGASFDSRETLVKSCLETITEDGRINEGELIAFRAICEFFELPISLLPSEVSAGSYQRDSLV